MEIDESRDDETVSRIDHCHVEPVWGLYVISNGNDLPTGKEEILLPQWQR